MFINKTDYDFDISIQFICNVIKNRENLNKIKILKNIFLYKKNR